MKKKIKHAQILKLNKHWMPIGFCTTEEAFVGMSSGALVGLHMEFPKGEDGEWDFATPTETYPVEWEDWMKLPIREYDEEIHTSKLTIRIPKIVITTNFDKFPKVTPKMTHHSIFERDSFTCSYTGQKYEPHEAHKYLNIDHVIPRAQGGKSTWENLVTSSKVVNSQKADKTPAQAGLKLLKIPHKPKPRAAAFKAYADGRLIEPQVQWLMGPMA